jgi:TatA/E family protein of Tat protein translocase
MRGGLIVLSSSGCQDRRGRKEDGMPDVSGAELLIVIVVIALLFGAARIPDAARNLGEGLRELRRGLRGEDDEAAS